MLPHCQIALVKMSEKPDFTRGLGVKRHQNRFEKDAVSGNVNDVIGCAAEGFAVERGSLADAGPDRRRPCRVPLHRGGFISRINLPPQARPGDKLIEIVLGHVGDVFVGDLSQSPRPCYPVETSDPKPQVVGTEATKDARCYKCGHVQPVPVSQQSFRCEQCDTQLKRRVPSD
jgi:hypothetical protein